MTSDELKRELESILSQPVSLQVYFVLKTQNGIKIKLADIDNGDTNNNLKAIFLNKINEEFVHNEQLSVLELSTTDERMDAIYHYDLKDIPDELQPINSFNLQKNYETFSFEHDDLKYISGFIILLGTRDRNIILYKKQYPICLIKRDSFMMFKHGERFVEMKEDLIRLSSEFEFIRIGQDLFIKKLSILEKFFGFHAIIKKEAALALNKIEEKGIIEDVEVLRDAIDDVTFARKLTKVRNSSPVLTMDISVEQIINFTKNTPVLAGRFKYTQDDSKIRLDTKKSKEAFVKLLNDDFLKSELTQLYYDSLAKDKLHA